MDNAKVLRGKAASKKWRSSPKGKATLKRWWNSEIGKASLRRYSHSAKAKARRHRYETSSKGRATVAKYRHIRSQQDPNARILKALRFHLWRALKQQGIKRHLRTTELLGCSVPNFRLYIASRFEPGMSWDNYGRGNGRWSIDHIVPVSLFDLTNHHHQKVCFHFSNLQPMWHIENLMKSNKLKGNQQLNLPV